jgi:hypothetical protein
MVSQIQVEGLLISIFVLFMIYSVSKEFTLGQAFLQRQEERAELGLKEKRRDIAKKAGKNSEGPNPFIERASNKRSY